MRILVTGANGHLGINLCRTLLEHGHRVRASVRSLADGGKTASLRRLDRVELVQVDLLEPAQFRAALDGIEVFFHLAAHYAYVVEPGREEETVVRPSVEGAENAIRAAADAGVRKVVFTSSTMSLPLSEPGASPVTEDDWAQDLHVPYIRAKTVAEQRAWERARERNVNLVTVLPGGIFGPGFERNTPSIDLIECIMLGYFRMGIPGFNLACVDIRDTVNAHVLAAEKDCAGRFIVCYDHSPAYLELNQIMHGIDPSVPLPLMRMPELSLHVAPWFDRVNHWLLGTPRIAAADYIAANRGKVWNPSNARIKRELGWAPSISLEQSLADTMARIRENRARHAA